MNNIPIIIGGFYRSGTSLLRRLLDAHSAIHCAPEVKFLKDFHGDYLRDDLAHARFFSTVRSLGVPDSDLLQIFGGAFATVHDRACARAGKRRWADKNPENVLYLSDWRAMLPCGFQFVHVIRNPLDALASLKEVGFRRAVPELWSDKVRLYAAYRTAGAAYCRACPESSVTIAYEDLVGAPEQTMSALFAFLGEAFEPAVLANFNSPARGYGIEDPKVAKTSHVHNNSVGRWQRDLTDEEVAVARTILSMGGIAI